MPLEKSSINASAEIISKPSAAYTTRAKLANIIRREKLTPQTSRKKTRYGLKPLDSSAVLNQSCADFSQFNGLNGFTVCAGVGT